MNARLHYLVATFFIGLYTNTTLSFLQGAIVSRAFGAAYSAIFFFATVLSVGFYLALSVSSLRRQLSVHAAFMLLSAIGMVVLASGEGAASPLLLYGIGIIIVLQDFISPGILWTQVSESMPPAECAEISRKSVGVQLAARGVATILVLMLAHWHWLPYIGAVVCAVAALHFIFLFFSETAWSRTRTIKVSVEIPEDRAPLKSAFRFLWKNPLVRAATLISVVGVSTKFLVDVSILQVTELRTRDLGASTTIFSQIGFISIVVVYLFQKFIAAPLLASRPLSQLFAIIPSVTLLATVATLFYPEIALVAAIYIINQATARSINIPVVRQLFLFVPLQLRNTVYQLSLVHFSLFSAALGGLLALFRTSLNLEHTLFLIVALCVASFFIIAEMDQYFLRNLWNHYKQSSSGRWLGHVPLDVSSLFSFRPLGESSRFEPPASYWEPADIVKLLGENPKDPFLVKSLLVHGYERSRKKEHLAVIAMAHRRLLNSRDEAERLLAQEVSFLVGMPRYQIGLNQEFQELEAVFRSWSPAHLAAATRLKLRFALIDARRNMQVEECRAKIHWLLENASPGSAAAFIDVIYNRLYSEILPDVYQCLNHDGAGVVDLGPLLEHFVRVPYGETKLIRNALERIGPRYGRRAIWKYIDTSCGTLLKSELQGTDRRNVLARALFLEEWLLDGKRKNAYLRETIHDLWSASNERDRNNLLLDLHREALKTSRRFEMWQQILNQV